MSSTNDNAEGLVRVLFSLEPAWHGSVTERLWAKPIGEGQFRLRNTPFFTFGISAEDDIVADWQDDQLVFTRVTSRGGHSTYRIRVVKEKAHLFPQYWKPLQDLGCTYEEGLVFAVDVPPGVNIYEVYRALEKGEADGAWGFEEGHCGHPLIGKNT